MSTRRLLLIWALLLAGIVCLAQQPTKAYWQSRDSNYNISISGTPAYTGPGDVVGSALGWWGLRCYNSAYTGSVVDITDSATGTTTGTRLQCATGGTISAVVSASACTFVTGNACSALATTCAVACNVNTLYDQSGAGNCSGACNVLQATNAQRPSFTSSGCAGLTGTQTWCIVFNGTNSNLLSTATWSGSTVTQPYTALCAANFTAHPANGTCTSVGNNTTGGYIINVTATPAIFLYAGSNASVAGGATNTWYSIQGIFNGASTAGYVNGSSTTGLSAGTQTVAAGNKAYFGSDPFLDLPTSLQVEAGLWSGGFSAGNQSAMNSNIRTFWGF